MSDHFNKLTPAEAERLAMLIEEAAEVQQIAAKILRFGYESFHPDIPTVSNRQRLDAELRDLIAVHILMMERSDLDNVLAQDIPPLIERKLRFSHHQES